MNELFIVRHGIAVEPGTAGIADADRPLTPKGAKRMRQVGDGLFRLDLKLERIVTSPLPRARQTAEIVAEALDLADRVEVASVLEAGASAATIERWLRERAEERLMIVGHNPSLSDLISLLLMGSAHPLLCDLKKGAVAALKRAISGQGRYNLAWIAPPLLFRRLDGSGDD
jgi:phosphohistidine phosphatase